MSSAKTTYRVPNGLGSIRKQSRKRKDGTLDVYGHVTEKMKQDSAIRMESFINSLSSLQ